MLNWDDPIATAAPRRTAAAPPQAEPALRAHDTAEHVRPGRGVVSNDVLMATAGDAPVVSPEPAALTEDLCRHDYDHRVAGGATGLESL